MADQSPNVMCYVLDGKPVRKVCVKKHRGTNKCRAAHAVPSNCLWSGEWPKEFFGDLVEYFKELRRNYANAKRRWATRHNRLAAVHPAPAFAAWHKAEMGKHLAARPQLVINPPKPR